MERLLCAIFCAQHRGGSKKDGRVSATRTFAGNREISLAYTRLEYNMVCDKDHMSGTDEEKGVPGEFK